jgi:hypothetical protein
MARLMGCVERRANAAPRTANRTLLSDPALIVSASKRAGSGPGAAIAATSG